MRRYMNLMDGEVAKLKTLSLTGLLSFAAAMMMFLSVSVSAQTQSVIVNSDSDSEGTKNKDKEEGFTVGFMFGPAIPSTSVADIYGLAGDDGVGEAYDVAANLGYNLAFRGRFGLGENVSLSGGVMYATFPNNDFYIKDGSGEKVLVQTATYIIPVYAGLALFPTRGTITPMLAGHFMYTYRGTTVSEGNIVADILEPGQELEPVASRVGASIEAAVEFDLGLKPFISLSYVWSNLIGNEENEAVRSFLTVNVGLMF